MKNSAREFSALRGPGLAVFLFVAASSAWGQATVTGMNLVSSTRVGRTTFDYTYSINVTNGAAGLANVVATVTSSAAATTIVQGSVALGTLVAGASTTSTNTFTLQQDRTVAFNPASLTWTVTGTPFDVVPNVISSTQTNASSAIIAAGLLATVTTANSSTVPLGDVISQSPSPGASVAPGSVVNLVVSSGPMQAGPPVNGLLPGSPNSLAVSEIVDYATNPDFPAGQFEATPDGLSVLRTEIGIIFQNGTTVGQVNALVSSIQGQIIATNTGSLAVVVQVPDSGTVVALNALEQSVAAFPSVSSVVSSLQFFPDGLPPAGNYNDPPQLGELTDEVNYLAVGFGGAWGISASVLSPSPLTLVMIDYFGNGLPGPSLAASTVTSDWAATGSTTEQRHGYGVASVALISSGTWQGGATSWQSGQSPVRLRVIDLYGTGGAFKGTLSALSSALAIIRSEAGTGRKVVLNTSLNQFSGGAAQSAQANALVDALATFWTYGVTALTATAGAENFLQVTSSGNQAPGDPPFAPLAAIHSAFTRAQGMGLENIIVVGGTNLATVPAADPVSVRPLPAYCPAPSAYVPSDVQGILGQWTLWLDDPTTTASASKTSFATPEVASAALLTWAANPELSVSQVRQAVVGTAATPVVCDPNPNLPTMDAYAAILAGDDKNENARLALLDVAKPGPNGAVPGQDGVFNEWDLAMLVSQIVARHGAQLDYSRYDLNGDGMTGGPSKAAFDLDNSFDGTTRASLFNSALNVTIAGIQMQYDENNLTDSQIVCYYAYSPLFTPSNTTWDERPLILAPIASDCGLTLDHVQLTFSNLPVGWSGSGATALQSFSVFPTPAAFSSVGDPGSDCGSEVGAPDFSGFVATGAYFLAVDSVTNPPHENVHLPNRTPCSSFFAVQGRDVWINVTAENYEISCFGGSCPAFEWEDQVRLYSGDPANNRQTGYVQFGTVSVTDSGPFMLGGSTSSVPLTSLQIVYKATQ